MKYEIKGGSFPVVICNLENGEKMITEKGSMAWMSPNMQMETHGGGLGRMLSKAFSGESMFQNHYTARGGAGMIAFTSSFPGEIKVLEIGPGQEMIVQKSAFLAAEAGVNLSIHFQKRLGAGFFGGEGFIMLQHRSDRSRQSVAADHAHLQCGKCNPSLHPHKQQLMPWRKEKRRRYSPFGLTGNGV